MTAISHRELEKTVHVSVMNPSDPLTKTEFCDLLKQTLSQRGFPLTSLQLNQFVTYWSALKRWNARINLTAVRDDREIIVKHFLDSLSVLHHFAIQPGDWVIDIGTGAGFPGIPIKIYIPRMQLTLVESSAKKASFLRFVVSQFKREIQSGALATWNDVRIIAQRAQQCAKQDQHQHSYHWVFTRYVASLEDSIAYCLPLLKRDGTWIAYKASTAQLQSEIDAATPKLQSLGGRVQSIVNSHIPELNRTYVAIRTKELY